MFESASDRIEPLVNVAKPLLIVRLDETPLVLVYPLPVVLVRGALWDRVTPWPGLVLLS